MSNYYSTPESLNFSPHGNRTKVFPYAHIPDHTLINRYSLVNKIEDFRYDHFRAVFQESPPEFRGRNSSLGTGLHHLFKNNILFLCDLHGIGLVDLFKKINAMGVKGSYSAFLHGNGTKYFNLLFVAMFGRIFNIEPWVLVGVDLKNLFFAER